MLYLFIVILGNSLYQYPFELLDMVKEEIPRTPGGAVVVRLWRRMISTHSEVVTLCSVRSERLDSNKSSRHILSRVYPRLGDGRPRAVL